MEWCIRQLWCSSIIFYNITSIAYNHHTEYTDILISTLFSLLNISFYLQILRILIRKPFLSRNEIQDLMEDDDEEIGAAALDEPIDGDDDKDIASQVNLGIEELGSYIYGGGLYSILVVYCFMWSGALDSSDVPLS